MRRVQSLVRRLVAVVLAAALLQACSSSAVQVQVRDRFSEATATTWRVAGDTIVFERTEARFSRSARDYVYLGPVAVNERGTYAYFLWIGIGSTLDRGFLAPETTLPTTISLFLDGEPLELVSNEWSRSVPDLSGELPYDTPVSLQWQLAARVTLDQIEQIESRGIDRLMLHTADGNAREFQPWADQSAWQQFVSQIPR